MAPGDARALRRRRPRAARGRRIPLESRLIRAACACDAALASAPAAGRRRGERPASRRGRARARPADRRRAGDAPRARLGARRLRGAPARDIVGRVGRALRDGPCLPAESRTIAWWGLAALVVLSLVTLLVLEHGEMLKDGGRGCAVRLSPLGPGYEPGRARSRCRCSCTMLRRRVHSYLAYDGGSWVRRALRGALLRAGRTPRRRAGPAPDGAPALLRRRLRGDGHRSVEAARADLGCGRAGDDPARERRTLAGDVAGALLLAASLFSHTTGLAFGPQAVRCRLRRSPTLGAAREHSSSRGPCGHGLALRPTLGRPCSAQSTRCRVHSPLADRLRSAITGRAAGGGSRRQPARWVLAALIACGSWLPYGSGCDGSPPPSSIWVSPGGPAVL